MMDKKLIEKAKRLSIFGNKQAYNKGRIDVLESIIKHISRPSFKDMEFTNAEHAENFRDILKDIKEGRV